MIFPILVLFIRGYIALATLKGVPIAPTTTVGATVRDESLVVAQASRALAGAYTCAAANSEGASTSLPLGLRVKCQWIPRAKET